MREFQEESGLLSSQYRIFENIDPIRETFFGNNKIHYCHIYYIAWVPYSIKLKLNSSNELMIREVGNIGWYSVENALSRIRNTNLEKREILLRTSSLLRNLCPMLVGPVASYLNIAVTSEQNEDELNNRSRDHESGEQHVQQFGGWNNRRKKSGTGSGSGTGSNGTGSNGSGSNGSGSNGPGSNGTGSTNDTNDESKWTKVNSRSVSNNSFTANTFKFVED
jgi:hypothetical protein